MLLKFFFDRNGALRITDYFLFGKQKDIYEAIQETILSPNSFLYAEPEFLLQKEVSEVGSYFSILKVIASGNHKELIKNCKIY